MHTNDSQEQEPQQPQDDDVDEEFIVAKFRQMSDELRREALKDLVHARDVNEGILNQRFNFHLAFVGATIVGVIACNQMLFLQITLLIFGILLSWLFHRTVHRAFLKVDKCLDVLHNPEFRHVFSLVDQAANASRRWGNKSARKWVGFWIPLLSTWFLISCLIASSCGLLRESSSESRATYLCTQKLEERKTPTTQNADKSQYRVAGKVF